ncbi:hypothetical protein TNIN_85021 [Trichonephila inaurata madagascariensis]|uniref:Uncharacterized protein n=1 Tax=Trichonephila inaurata madagascariensis TaxID=2747483 RepID=A0A8X6J032_9ARAC|nr:hypothetical protein TNIN_85021 [Trichonephila inaurata madagascariensis]
MVKLEADVKPDVSASFVEFCLLATGHIPDAGQSSASRPLDIPLTLNRVLTDTGRTREARQSSTTWRYLAACRRKDSYFF